MRKALYTFIFSLIAISGVAQELKLDTKNAKVAFVFTSESLEGTVGGVEATITLDFTDLSNSKINGSADVSTLSTVNKMRDKHLKSKDYFDAENHPQMSFTSTSITKEGDDYIASGVLTIKETTKEVYFNIETSDESLVLTTTINADDYDVSPKKSEKSNVEITVTVPLQK